MKKFWILASIVIVAVAAWELRDRLPFVSQFVKQASAETEGNGNSGQRRRGGGAPVMVKTVEANRAQLAMDVTATGAADADDNTTIAAQEQGLVISITATDGATVKAGDLIAKLDDRTAKATVDKDRAMLVRDQATLAQAQTALQRAEDLVQRNAGTQQTADQAQEARDTAAATADGDKAALAADEVVLEHTEIRAPFDGRLGDIAVSPGAFVSAGAAIVTIEKYNPIYVKFHLPEAYLGQLKTGFDAGAVAVDAVPDIAQAPTIRGQLSFFDNTVDPASGTILAKARFDNPTGALWPGQSVNVTLHFASSGKDIVVPTVAISPGADSPFVYTVGGDKKVHVTPVKVSRSNGDDSAITEGLAEGAHVVVEGQVQLIDGQTVTEEFNNASGDKQANTDAAPQPVVVGVAQ